MSSIERFLSELQGRLTGKEQAIFVMSPKMQEELGVSAVTADIIMEESRHALSVSFHWIEGYLCITISHAKSVEHAEETLKFFLFNLGVSFVRTIV